MFVKISEQPSLYNDLEKKSVREILEDINTEDQKVALAVQRAIPQIEKLVTQIVIFDESFHGALDDCTQLDTHFFGSFCQNFLVIEGYGTDEMYFLMLIVFILHDIAFKECLKAVQYQSAYTRFTQILCKKW